MLLLVMGEERGGSPLQGGSGRVLGTKNGAWGGRATYRRGHRRGSEGGRGGGRRVGLVVRVAMGRRVLLLLLLGFFLLLDVVGKVEMVWFSMTVHEWDSIWHSACTLLRG